MYGRAGFKTVLHTAVLILSTGCAHVAELPRAHELLTGDARPRHEVYARQVPESKFNDPVIGELNYGVGIDWPIDSSRACCWPDQESVGRTIVIQLLLHRVRRSKGSRQRHLRRHARPGLS